MKQIGIYYGSSTGTTAEAARHIAENLGVTAADIHDVAKALPSTVADYDILLLGTSTWGNGDLQDDWYDFIAALEAMDLTGKDIAIFGEGDETMTDTFCDAVGELYEKLKATGARIIGAFNVDGYTFEASRAVRRDDTTQAVGLLLDDTNHPDLTMPRIEAWTSMLKAEEAL